MVAKIISGGLVVNKARTNEAKVPNTWERKYGSCKHRNSDNEDRSHQAERLQHVDAFIVYRWSGGDARYQPL